MKMPRVVVVLAGICLLSVGVLALSGCEERERILEVETPRRSLQIDRVEKGSDIEIDLERKSDD